MPAGAFAAVVSEGAGSGGDEDGAGGTRRGTRSVSTSSATRQRVSKRSGKSGQRNHKHKHKHKHKQQRRRRAHVRTHSAATETPHRAAHFLKKLADLLPQLALEHSEFPLEEYVPAFDWLLHVLTDPALHWGEQTPKAEVQTLDESEEVPSKRPALHVDVTPSSSVDSLVSSASPTTTPTSADKPSLSRPGSIDVLLTGPNDESTMLVKRRGPAEPPSPAPVAAPVQHSVTAETVLSLLDSLTEALVHVRDHTSTIRNICLQAQRTLAADPTALDAALRNTHIEPPPTHSFKRRAWSVSSPTGSGDEGTGGHASAGPPPTSSASTLSTDPAAAYATITAAPRGDALSFYERMEDMGFMVYPTTRDYIESKMPRANKIGSHRSLHLSQVQKDERQALEQAEEERLASIPQQVREKLGTIIYATPSCTDYLGYDPFDLQARPYLRLVAREDRPTLERCIRAALSAPHPPAGGHHPTLSLLQGSSRQGSNTLRLHGSSSTSSLSRLASPGNKTWPGKVTEAQTSAHVSLKRAREDGGGTVRVFMRVHARALGGDHTDDDDSEEDEDHAAPSSRPQPVLLLCTPVAPGKGSSLPGGAVSPLFPSTPRSRPTTPLHRLGGNLGPNDVPQVSLSNIYQDSSMRLKLLQRTPPPPTSSTRTVVHGKTAPIRAVSVPTSPASDSVLTGTDLKLAQPDGDGAAVDPNAPAAGPSSRATHLHSSLSLDSVESFSESVSSGDPGILPPALGVLSSINPDPVRTEAWGTREAQPSPTVSENESYTDSLLDLNDKPPTDTDEDEEDAERAKQQLPLISVDAPSADAVGPSLRTLSASPTPGTPQVSSSPGFQRAVSRLIHLLPEEEDRAVSPMSAGRKLLGQPQAAPTPSHVVELPRGGTLVRTSQGLLQFGMPPETIKDTMSLGFDVPTHFVMPKILFDREAGINVAEFEFPAYWNFFILKKQVSLVTTPDVAERVRRVFTHTLIGPKVENDDEFLGEEAQRCKPDLNKECGWFNTHPYKPGERLQNDSMVHFIFYDDQRVAQVWDGVTVCDQGHEFVLYDQGKEIFRTSVMVQLPRIFEPRSPRRQSTSADPSPRASPMSTSADEAAGTSGSYVDGDFALRDSATGGDDAGAGRLLDVPSRMRGSSGGGSNTGSAFPVSPTLSGVSTGSNTSWDDGGEPEAEDADQDEEARQLRRHSTEFAQEHNLHVDVGIGGDPEMALCSPLPSPTSGGQGSGGDSMQRLYSFNPPQFGVTFLGTSHGFDPTGTTTGFVLWVNGKGFMVDPPPRSGQLLKLYGIAPILIDGVIVTHCHADHDAGTFHKILEDRRVTVLTTPTIMRSFLAKYSAISGIEEALLRRLFVFRPVRIGEPMNIHGSHLHFFYSLHAIPCIGFECYYGGKSMVYSADTMNNDTYINQMFEEGIMTEARRDALLSFPWHHTLVLHEAGVPPIHTPLSTFEKLTEEEKERLYLVHVTASKVPPESGLKVAKEGVANTIVIPIEEAPIFSNATNVLQLLSTLEFFNNLSLTQTTELLQICEFEEYEAGTVITNAGDGGESYTFYVIVSGVVRSVKRNGNTYYLSSGDYFGYKSLTSSGQVRSSSTHMAAETTLCLRFQRHPLRRLLAGSQSLRKMRRMEKLRRPVSRRTGHVDEAGLEVIRLNTVLGTMEHSQRAVLRQYLHRQTVEAGDVIIPFGQAPAKAVLVGRDTVLRVEVDDDAFAQRSDQVRRPPRLLGIGAFVADVHAMLHNADLRRPADDSLREDDDEAAQHDSGKTIIPSFVKVTVRKPGVLFTIAASHLMHFFEAHPGVLISFLNTTYRV